MGDDEYIFCDNCEENWNCPDATRLDGCVFGIKTVDDNKKEKLNETNTRSRK